MQDPLIFAVENRWWWIIAWLRPAFRGLAHEQEYFK